MLLLADGALIEGLNMRQTAWDARRTGDNKASEDAHAHARAIGPGEECDSGGTYTLLSVAAVVIGGCSPNAITATMYRRFALEAQLG